MNSNNRHSEYRFILSGGGTGGHLFPALAIAEELRNRFPSCEIIFVGAKGKLEMEQVPKAGYPIIGLKIGGIQRKKCWKNILLPVYIIQSLLKCRQIIRKFSPSAAIGTGGYASFPLIYSASGKGIPTIIHESNFFPGITNKYLAKKVDKILTAYEGMEKFFPKEKIVISGNPVRKALLKQQDIETARKFFGIKPGKKVLLVTGGSLGSRTINQAILKNIQAIQKQQINLIWQTGSIYYDQMITELKGKETDGLWISAFISDMAMAYCVADLVIARAGAITLTELSVVGKAVVLVPSPNVAEDHQTKNARHLAENNAALLLRDQDAIEKLIPLAIETLNNESLLCSLSSNIKKLAIPDATLRIVDEIEKLLARA